MTDGLAKTKEIFLKFGFTEHEYWEILHKFNPMFDSVERLFRNIGLPLDEETDDE